MLKKCKDHTWKHVLCGLFIFLLGFFACKLLVYKKMFVGRSGAYLHMKASDKEAKLSQWKNKVDYEERLEVVEEKVRLLEEPSTE